MSDLTVVVGGIVIMNIMLMAVVERTREIGYAGFEFTAMDVFLLGMVAGSILHGLVRKVRKGP